MISLIRQGIYNTITSFQQAKKTKQIPLWLITAYSIYIPFEDYINSLIPVAPVRLLLSFVPELIFYGVAVLVLYQKFRFGGGIKKTPVDPLVIALILSILISIFINHSSLPGSFKNLRIHFRYISIYYILVNINISQAQLNNLLEKLKILGLIQSIIASIQFFLPKSINVALSSPVCATIIQSKGANCGTFNDNAILAAYLLVTLTVFVSSYYLNNQQLLLKNKKNLLVIFVIIFGLFASKKRASLAVGILAPLVIFWFLKKGKFLLKYLWVLVAVAMVTSLISSIIPPAPDPLAQAQGTDLSSFGALFTEEYWRANAENSRGWLIIVIVTSLIKSGQFWFGFGTELGVVPKQIEQFLSDPEDVAQLYRNLFVFEDPYWFAILAYLGIVGLTFYWLIIIRLAQVAKSLMQFPLSNSEKNIAISLQTLTVIGLLYGFAERLFMLRSFSFYFWLFAGLITNRYISKYEQSQGKINPKMLNLTKNS